MAWCKGGLAAGCEAGMEWKAGFKTEAPATPDLLGPHRFATLPCSAEDVVLQAASTHMHAQASHATHLVVVKQLRGLAVTVGVHDLKQLARKLERRALKIDATRAVGAARQAAGSIRDLSCSCTATNASERSTGRPGCW